MRKKIIRGVAALIIAFAGVFMLTGSSIPANVETESSASMVSAETTTTKDATVEDPGVLEEFGPPGVMLSTIIGGILLIIRNLNEGKRIDVQLYKDRAAEAENRSNIEIGKAQTKVEEIEKRLDTAIADRDRYRSILEERKAHFSDQLLAAERRHQEQIIDTHASLTIQLGVRYGLEQILSSHGIRFKVDGIEVTEL